MLALVTRRQLLRPMYSAEAAVNASGQHKTSLAIMGHIWIRWSTSQPVAHAKWWRSGSWKNNVLCNEFNLWIAQKKGIVQFKMKTLKRHLWVNCSYNKEWMHWRLYNLLTCLSQWGLSIATIRSHMNCWTCVLMLPQIRLICSLPTPRASGWKWSILVCNKIQSRCIVFTWFSS